MSCVSESKKREGERDEGNSRLERKKSRKLRGSSTENTAGFGSVGPNSGTPSLAVTATL